MSDPCVLAVSGGPDLTVTLIVAGVFVLLGAAAVVIAVRLNRRRGVAFAASLAIIAAIVLGATGAPAPAAAADSCAPPVAECVAEPIALFSDRVTFQVVGSNLSPSHTLQSFNPPGWLASVVAAGADITVEYHDEYVLAVQGWYDPDSGVDGDHVAYTPLIPLTTVEVYEPTTVTIDGAAGTIQFAGRNHVSGVLMDDAIEAALAPYPHPEGVFMYYATPEYRKILWAVVTVTLPDNCGQPQTLEVRQTIFEIEPT